jgi:hypothetical protein
MTSYQIIHIYKLNQILHKFNLKIKSIKYISQNSKLINKFVYLNFS